jgi:hypothetical protein
MRNLSVYIEKENRKVALFVTDRLGWQSGAIFIVYQKGT